MAIATASGQTNSLPDTDWLSDTNSYWKALGISSAIYDTPYRITLFSPQNGEDSSRVWSQTKSVFVYGLGVIGFLALLPQDYTDWETDPDIFKKWVENVTEGPEWDRNTTTISGTPILAVFITRWFASPAIASGMPFFIPFSCRPSTGNTE
jgi:hypothetical protein